MSPILFIIITLTMFEDLDLDDIESFEGFMSFNNFNQLFETLDPYLFNPLPTMNDIRSFYYDCILRKFKNQMNISCKVCFIFRESGQPRNAVYDYPIHKEYTLSLINVPVDYSNHQFFTLCLQTIKEQQLDTTNEYNKDIQEINENDFYIITINDQELKISYFPLKNHWFINYIIERFK